MSVTDSTTILTMIRNHSGVVKAILVGLSAVVLSLVGTIPLYQRANSTQKSLEETRLELKDVTERVVILSNLDETVLQQRVTVLDTILPPSKDVVAYLVALDGLSRELGLSLGDIQLAPGQLTSSEDIAKRVSKLGALATEVRIVGEAESIYSLLRQIETIAPLMQVKNVVMTRVGIDGDIFSLQLQLSMLYSDPVISSTTKGVVSLFNNREEELFQRLSGFKRYVLPSAGQGSVAGKVDLFSPLGSISQDQESSLQENPLVEDLGSQELATDSAQAQ